MKRQGWLRRVAEFLPAVCIGILAGQPFLAGQVSQRGDTLLHLERIAQLDALFQQGVLFSRWAPDLGMGFGYPLFNYYAPLAYYLTGGWLLLGVPQSVALAFGFALLSVIAAVGAFAWFRSMFDTRTGWVGAAAYVLSPYVLANATGRGAFAEQLALALMPGLLFCAHRIANGSGRAFWALVVLGAGMLLGHNISALLFLPLLLICFLAWSMIARSPRRIAWLRFALGLALGFGIAAFFWLPALAERNLVFIERTTQPVWATVSNNFVALANLFVLPTTTDPKLIQIDYPPGLSPVALMGFAGLAVCIVARLAFRIRIGDRGWWSQVAILAVGAVLCVWMTSEGSGWLWDRLPLAGYIQFPSRWFGPASLFASGLAGAVATRFLSLALPARFRVGAILVFLSAISALVFHRQVLAAPLDATSFSPRQMAEFEARTFLFGSTSGGEYTPRTVLQTPEFSDSRWQEPVDLIVRKALVPGASVTDLGGGLLAPRFNVSGPVASTLTLRMFAFPGWGASVDGAEAALSVAQPFGLISVDVPAGRHDVQFSFGTSPLRRFAEIVSAATLALCVVLAIAAGRRRRGRVPQETVAIVQTPGAELLAVCGCVLGLLLLKTIYVDHAQTAFIATRLTQNGISDARWQTHAVFGEQFEWLGADGSDTARAGERVKFRLYWRVTRPIQGELSTSIQVVNAAGQTIAQSDNFVAAGLATFYWEPGQYAIDSHSLLIPADALPGEYSVRVVVFPRDKPLQQILGQTLPSRDQAIVIRVGPAR